MDLTYVTRGDGCLHCDLPNGVTGKFYIAATAPTVRIPNGACGRLWSNTYTLVLAYT
jgi:hypothetical protein